MTTDSDVGDAGDSTDAKDVGGLAHLEDFVGQESVKATLRRLVSSAQAQGTGLVHVLLIGEPGTGKRTLAQAVANEIGANFRATRVADYAPGDLASVLTKLHEGDILLQVQPFALP